MPPSGRTMTWNDLLFAVSNVSPATAARFNPLATALSRSGAVVGTRSNCRPSVGGRFTMVGNLVKVTSRPFWSKIPSSFATSAGSHVITGI